MSNQTEQESVGLVQLLRISAQKIEDSEQLLSIVKPLSFRPIETGFNLYDVGEYLMISALKLKSAGHQTPQNEMNQDKKDLRILQLEKTLCQTYDMFSRVKTDKSKESLIGEIEKLKLRISEKQTHIDQLLSEVKQLREQNETTAKLLEQSYDDLRASADYQGPTIGTSSGSSYDRNLSSSLNESKALISEAVERISSLERAIQSHQTQLKEMHQSQLTPDAYLKGLQESLSTVTSQMKLPDSTLSLLERIETQTNQSILSLKQQVNQSQESYMENLQKQENSLIQRIEAMVAPLKEKEKDSKQKKKRLSQLNQIKESLSKNLAVDLRVDRNEENPFHDILNQISQISNNFNQLQKAVSSSQKAMQSGYSITVYLFKIILSVYKNLSTEPLPFEETLIPDWVSEKDAHDSLNKLVDLTETRIPHLEIKLDSIIEQLTNKKFKSV